MKNLFLMIRYVFITPWCITNRLEGYSIVILSAQTSGMAASADLFSGVFIILNNNEFNKIYLSANISTFLIAVFVWDNLAKYKHISLKYGWTR